MIGLIRVEVARYRSRRGIVLLVLLAAVLAAVVAFSSAWDTRPPSHEELATAQAQADMAAQRDDVKNDLDKCLADPGAYLGLGTTAQDCRDSLVAGPQSYLPRVPLDLAGTLQGNGTGIAVLVIGLLIIAGCVFAGADWGSGAMAGQLLFESRRPRVWVAKAIAVTLWSGLVSLVVLGGFWITLYAVAADRGVPHGSGLVSDIGWHLARAVAAAMGAGLGAFALTMIFRSAAGTLSLLFAYSVGGELLVSLLPFDGTTRWAPGSNLFAWLQPHPGTVPCGGLGSCGGTETLTHLGTGLYLGILLVIAVAASLPVFGRRDA